MGTCDFSSICKKTAGFKRLTETSKFLRPAQRYDNFKLIKITCQAACHGKSEHGIFVI